MIISNDWIWLHFPKAAGTSVEKALSALFGRDKNVVFDKIDQSNVIWHHSLEARLKYDPSFAPGQRRVICNIRRLPSWILSRVHFEVQRHGKAGLICRDDLVSGRFGVLGPGGRTKKHSADDVLRRFLPGVTHWVRMEHLSEDLALAVSLENLQVAAAVGRENRGKIDYIRDVPFWFSAEDLRKLYAANPLWADLERHVYGDVLGG